MTTTRTSFVHLHNHTEYSFLDGAMRVKDMVKRAAEFGMPALAITDHGGMFGVIEFYEACLAEGIKPIIGFEAYVAPGSRYDKTSVKDEHSNNHLVLLAKNNEGYRNLMRLSSIGYLEGFYYKPRIDLEVLRAHSSGIIATTACIAGSIPRLLLERKRDQARQVAIEYLDIFGKGNFFFELQNHGIEEEYTVFTQMIDLGKELGIPFIVTNDAHYLNRDDARSHEILLCIQTQTVMSDPKRYRFSSDQVYFKSPSDMLKLFPHLPEAYANTVRIAEMCNVSVKEKPMLPRFEVPGGATPEAYLAQLAHKGAQERYGNLSDALKERLEYELKVICEMGFASYFLIIEDFVREARRQGIMIGCRGSAAGSMVAFCIGITDVDPIRFGLIFERFLNPERISMPDADIDFADAHRYKIIDYVVKKYGRNAVCQIINISHMKAKMVIKDVARAMSITVSEANRLSSMVNEDSLQSSLASNGELARLIDSNPQYKELFTHARMLEGLARQAGMHAGGIIIAPGEVVNWAPLFKQPNSDVIMTQYNMTSVEKVGLVKMDFLGLRTLTVLQETLRLIKEYHGVEIDLWKLPEADPKTMELFGRGETVGIFQFESQGMQDNLRKLKPEGIEDLIAMNALYRPGPMDNIPAYILRKHGKEKVEYPHPMLEEVLKITYGVITYQEQVMRAAQCMGGFTLGQADILRKAMGKKQLDVMEQMRARFVEGAKKRSVKPEVAEEIFDRMAKFAEYGFNKAHATVYAHVAYQSAYLKVHYPLEYMTANLTSWLGDQDKFLVIKNEAERMGITVLPPDVNFSSETCSVENGKIRLGLAAIKNVGNAAGAIIQARAARKRFETIFDFCKSVDLKAITKKTLESLIYAGACDSLKGTRAQLFSAIDHAIEYGASFQKERQSGQMSLFDALGTDSDGVPMSLPEPQLPAVSPWPYHELLAHEKEVLNFFVSGHPLDRFQDELRGFTTTTLSPQALERLRINENVTVGGIVISARSHVQKDGKPMAFLMLEDYEGKIELVAFGDAYSRFNHLLVPGAMILVHGKVLVREGENEPKLRVENVIPLADSREQLARSVHVRIYTQGLEKEFLQELQQECASVRGRCALILHLVTGEKNEYCVHSRKFSVAADADTIRRFREKIGKENVWISKSAAA